MLLLSGCDDAIGEEGTRLPQPLSALSGGVVFATRAISGANGYDLFYAPFVGTNLSEAQGFLQLTTTDTDDVQPAVAANGAGLAFARRDEGIFFVAADGLVSRITDTRGTSLVDSLPAVSADADRVAWVREDRSRPIGASGFFATAIWVANADATEPRPVNPKAEMVQDAPAFDPTPRSARLAWSELNATTLNPSGPLDYGVWVHDLRAAGGFYACRGDYEEPDLGVVRCFGQHLAWPERDRLVLAQQLLEIDPSLRGPTVSRLPALLNGLASGVGIPDRTASPSGFFAPFPLSVSYRGTQLLIDGLFRDFQGNDPTLAFFAADAEGLAPARFQVAGHQLDFDVAGTNGYLFSLATPQLIP